MFKPITPEQRAKIEELKLEEHRNEFIKCVNDQVYFYNKYVKPAGQKDLTKEEYDNFVKLVNVRMLKSRRHGGHTFLYPLTPDQCYQKKA